MIRSNVPLPLLFRLRLRANVAARRAQAGLFSHKRRSGIEAERALWARKALAVHAEAECSLALWNEFIEQYETVTSALCSAAKDGPTHAVEREFAIARRWFARHYAAIADKLRPYLEAEFTSPENGASGEPDTLEALIGAASLRELLARDTGDLIPRVARISEAVYRCDVAMSKR